MSLTKASYAMINGTPINVLDYGADAIATIVGGIVVLHFLGKL